MLLYLIFLLLGWIVLLTLGSFVIFELRKKEEARNRFDAIQKGEHSPLELKQDVDFYQDLLARVHPPPIPTFPLVDMGERMKVYQETINASKTRLAFYREFAPLIHQVSDEHLRVSLLEPDLTKHYEMGGLFFPLDIRILSGSVYLESSVDNGIHFAAGTQIMAINGTSVQPLLQQLMHYFPGTSGAQRLKYVEEGFHEVYFLAYGELEKFQLEMVDPSSNRVMQVSLPGEPRDKIGDQPYQYSILDPGTILFTSHDFNDGLSQFERFLETMFLKIKEEGIKNLIIDLRRNQGGISAHGNAILKYLMDEEFLLLKYADITISAEVRDKILDFIPSYLRWVPLQHLHPLLRPLWKTRVGEAARIRFDPVQPEENPLRFEGEVYVLIGPGTISSASLLAAAVAEYNIGILVGESMGGGATHYGNVFDFYLPHTGIKIQMPTCVNYGHGLGPIEPMYKVRQTLSDLIQGIDTQLAYTLKLIEMTSSA
jgi:hypothetical protein